MPTRKEMEKMAASAVGRDGPRTHTPSPADDMPSEYWQSVLEETARESRPAGPSTRALRLCDIPQDVLRVSCRRCSRTVEIQQADAVRLAGPEANWKEVGQRLLDDTCQQRTGRLEEDGCWPAFD
ncbi:hypothetical protein ACVWWO_004697 [Bradyrhizobium sp. F1.13.1]